MKSKYFIIFLVVIFSGCAYFNTFYNAKKLFKEAQEIPLNDRGRPKATAVQNYNKTIKKCGIILTDYQKSRWADDALFLLAKSLFYKGNSYIQAIEQFEDLILLYPESEFIPEAKIYIARSKFRFNKKSEAYTLLQEFIADPEVKDFHPEALMILANYHLEEKELVEANYTLNNLIHKYTKSDQFEDAFFLQGKTLNIDKKYQESNAVFQSLIKSRVSKSVKLDARYYIVLNYLEQMQYQKADNAMTKLFKDEFRSDKIPQLEIAKARALVGIGETEEAIEILQNIIDNNKNTKIAAEANYYLAETLFKIVGDYEGAIEAYNNVKSSFKASEFVEISLARGAVVSKIVQYNNPDSDIPTETLIEQQFKLAEFYNEVLNRPDSSLAIYDKIIAKEYELPTLIDSLESLKQNRILEKEALLNMETSKVDTTLSDSLDTALEQEFSYLDSIKIDTVNVNLDSYLNRSKEDLVIYNSDYIPFARFIKIWLLYNTYQDTTSAMETFQHFYAISPKNKYTIAAEKMINGEDFEIKDPRIERSNEQYQQALNLLESNPQEGLIKLQVIADNQDHLHSSKANYTLGYYRYFTENDTVNSKPYFNRVLAGSEEEYIDSVQKFYDGTNYKYFKRLTKIEQMETVDEEETQNEEEPDTDAQTISQLDSLNVNLNELTQNERSQDERTQNERTQNERSPRDFRFGEIRLLSEPSIIIPERYKDFPQSVDAQVKFLSSGMPNEIILDDNINPNTPLHSIITNTVRNWEYQIPEALDPTDQQINLNIKLLKKNKE